MDFALTDDRTAIRRAVAEIAGKFDDRYWMERDLAHEFPTAFYDMLASGGWLGVTIPEEFGGLGLGITEASIGSSRPGRRRGSSTGACTCAFARARPAAELPTPVPDPRRHNTERGQP